MVYGWYFITFLLVSLFGKVRDQLASVNMVMTIDKMPRIYTGNGDGFDVTPTGILLLAGDTAHGSPTQTTTIGRLKAADFIKRILSAATLAGYQHSDLLLTFLQWNIQSERVRTMAQEACGIAGGEAFESVFHPYKNGVTMQAVSTLFDRPLTSLRPMHDFFKRGG